MNPHITVLTSVYNGKKFLSHSIESILNQTYTNFEYLIIDDGSSDNSLAIINEYKKKDSRIRILQKHHSGLTDSLNLGLKEAKGEWIARMDADDISESYRLEKQYAFVKHDSNISCVGSGCIIINDKGINQKTFLYPSDHKTLFSNLLNNLAFFPHSSAFFNRTKVLALNGYNPFFIRSQDKDLWIRIAEKEKLASIREPLIKLRKHDDMISLDEGGQKQQIMSISAIICHYHRKNRLPDPSANVKDWTHLLTWLKKDSEVKRELHNHFKLEMLKKSLQGSISFFKKVMTILDFSSKNPFSSILFCVKKTYPKSDYRELYKRYLNNK